jgi:alanyl aminopeptidase
MPVRRSPASSWCRAATSAALLLTASDCASVAGPRTAAPSAAVGPALAATTANLAAEPPEAPPRLQLPGDVRPLRAALELTVRPAEPGFEGRVELQVELDRPRRVLWLHGLGLDVTAAEVEVGGVRLPASFSTADEDGLARLDLGPTVGPGRAVVRLAWRGAWGQVAGLYRWQDRGDWYAATMFEPIDARRAFPGFDEPTFKIPWEVTVVAPEELAVVSNTPEASAAPAGGGLRRVRFAPTPPLPSYLLFVAVGPFDVVAGTVPSNEVRPRPLPSRALVPRGRAAEAAYGLEAAGAIVGALERWFELPFPYEKLDHVVVTGFPGGMENAGAIAYDETWFLFAPGRTPEAQRREIASLLAHEIGHQWFGDLVTLGWWTDTWLNESFATWIDPKAVEAWRPEWRPGLELVTGAGRMMRADGLASARAVRQPLARMAEVIGQFDGMSYQKGAAVLAMFERWIGPARFRAGVRAFLGAHLHGTATTEDFLAALSAAAGRDLGPALSTFLDQPGVPLVTASPACGVGGAQVRLSQVRWQPRGATLAPAARWSVPVCLRGEASGRPFEDCTLLEEGAASLPLPGGCPDWLLPDAGGAGYYLFSLPPADLRRLLDRGLPRLSAGEKVALLGSLRAAYGAGALQAGDLLDAAGRLAADPDDDVVQAALPVFAQAHRLLEGDAARGTLEALVRRRLGPRFARLGWAPRAGEPERAGRLRAELLESLALVGHDPAVRAEAARRGALLLGLGGAPPRPDAVAPDLAGTALAVVVQERGAPAFEAAWRHHQQVTGELRAQVQAALFSSADPVLLRRAGALWREPGLGATERHALALATQAPPEAARATLARLELELGEILAAAPEGQTAWAPWAVVSLQEPGDSEAVGHLFGRHLTRYPGMERPLAQVLEQISIQVEARGRRAEVAAALRAAAR